jgi:homoserine O-acetyltransferase
MTLSCNSALAETPLQLAEIGDFTLSSGEVLKNAKIGFRTAGSLNVDKSNVLISPSWHMGTAKSIFDSDYVGSGRTLNTDKYYVIVIDALGNGVSTSPSNSTDQPGKQFPELTLGDMVQSQYVLLTQRLGISKLKAIVGLSMGGMQALEWLEQYPDFMDQVVSIEGTPRMTSYDLIQWQTHVNTIAMLQDSGRSDPEIFSLLMPLNLLTLWTPGYLVENILPEDLENYLAEYLANNAYLESNNYLIQTRAMMRHDALGSAVLEKAGMKAMLHEKLLMIGFDSDHMVNPGPSKELASEAGSSYIEIETDCGHMGTSCEAEKITGLVNDFLD